MENIAISRVVNPWGAPTLDGFDPNSFQPGQRARGSDRQYVRFYKKKVMEVHASKVRTNEKTGEVKVLATSPVEVEKEMVHIKTPGDKNEIEGYATDYHRREFWTHYKAFRDGNTAPLGLDIDEASFISPGIATELRYLGVHVVEQLADASDDLVNRIPDGWSLREFARTHCKAMNDGNVSSRISMLEDELKEAKRLIARLSDNTNKENSSSPIITSMEDITSEDKRGRGRPRKIKEV